MSRPEHIVDRLETIPHATIPARFDDFASILNDANVARLAYATAKEDHERSEAALRCARQRMAEAVGRAEILRREVLEHEAVAA